MIARGQNFKKFPLNISGSSTFGRYPKISIEKTYNMFISDGALVPYAGYQIGIPQSDFQNLMNGRGLHTSTKFNCMISVVGNKVFLVRIFFDQSLLMTYDYSATPIGTLQTTSGVVWIAENDAPQIAISDNTAIYIYDPTQTPPFQTVPGLQFTPGFLDFHDTYFLCAASDDQAQGGQSNTWRLSASNNGLSWPNDAAHIGLIQSKPDNTQAVVRFPSRGNAILVIGSVVAEPWFDVGYKLFPYQRQTSWNIDYGTLNPATVAYNDDIVVWLAANEKSGPIIVYTTGGGIEKITTDGIDYLFSQLTNPSDSQAFLYRQDGHLIYHINFYTDNLSLFYDFNTQKFYHASDENLNYFIANEVAFFNNQYYFVTKNNGNLYAFDTIYTTYDGAEIPRIRVCKNVRDISQQYFIVNDLGFTIEQGTTPYQLIQSAPVMLTAENGTILTAEDGTILITEYGEETGTTPLSLPRVDLSISTDGGMTFSSDFPYYMNPPAYGRNKLQWWQGGLCNDFVPQFKFWGMGRFVAFDGEANVRQ